MKTLQIKDSAHAPNGQVETIIHEDKSPADVLREQYHDRCISKRVEQPLPIRTGISRPPTHIVYDRSRAEDRNDRGEEVGVLIELP